MSTYLNSSATLEDRITDLLQQLSIDEKIKLLRGRDFWTTHPIERLHIPSFGMTDGPLGVAYHSSHKGKRTRFPSTIAVTATWNKDLAQKMGQAMGKETKLAGRHQILGPGVNLIRSPLCGRNFEYLSEDPVLASDMASAIVKGIQSEGIAACVKHYIANNSETKRTKISAEVSERALYELYIKNYKRIIEQADPWGMMVSYNKVNGIQAVESEFLLHEVLRNQIGFSGHLVTDWGAARNATKGAVGCIKAGLSLEMPGKLLSKTMTPKNVTKALEQNKITEKDIDYVLQPLLRTYFRVGLFDELPIKSQKILDIPEHQAIAQQIAEESFVLLKNENNFLPIQLDQIKKIAILGPNAKKNFGKPLHGGSSAVVPPKNITPFAGISDYIHNKVEIVDKVEEADVVFLVLGLDNGGSFIKTILFKPEGDTEGADRTRYELPPEQIELFYSVIAKNPNTVVLLMAGSPVDCSTFLERAPALLNVWYPGMMGGKAIAKVLFGEISPSGKLPITYPKVLSDHPAHFSEKRFPGDLQNLKIHYDEGIFVGYRYFDYADVEPQFPFGFGLSYSSFNLENLRVDKSILHPEDTFTLQVDITNTGIYAAAEVVQVYIQNHDTSVKHPPKELQAFEKIFLLSNETKTLSIELNTQAFEYYSEVDHNFVIKPGIYTIYVGNSSRNLLLHTKITYHS